MEQEMLVIMTLKDGSQFDSFKAEFDETLEDRKKFAYPERTIAARNPKMVMFKVFVHDMEGAKNFITANEKMSAIKEKYISDIKVYNATPMQM